MEKLALSYSGIKNMAQNPAYFLWKRKQKVISDALEFGKAFHCRVLEPEKFNEQVIVFTDGKTRTSQKYEKFAVDPMNKDKIILIEKEQDKLETMATAVLSEGSYSKEIIQATGNLFEQRIDWEDIESETPCKGFLDIHNPEKHVIADLKSVQSAEPETFSKQCANNGYHQQAAFYIDGMNTIEDTDEYEKFLFICVEKSAPYQVAVYETDTQFIDVGRARNRPLIDLFAKCLKSNNWPAYPNRAIELTLPRWANRIY